MNKNLLAVAAILLSLRASAAVIGPIVPSAQTVNVWAGLVGTTFGDPAADPAALSGVLTSLARLDLNDPAIRASVAPVIAEIQKAAPAMIASGQESLIKPSKGHALLKTRLLATALAPYLKEEQRATALEVARRHYEAMGVKQRAETDALTRSISGQWNAIPLDPALESAVLAGENPKKSLLGRLLPRPNPDKARPREAAFVKDHGPALRQVPGVISVRATTYDAHYSENNAVIVEVAPTADMAVVKKALAPYLFARIEIQVVSRGWEIYEIDRGAGREMRTLDERMSLSLKDGKGKMTERFVSLHGRTLLAVPGVESVRAVEYDVAYGEQQAVFIEVNPNADLDAIEKALEPYRYTGVEVDIRSRGWQISSLSGYDGEIRRDRDLDPRMHEADALSPSDAPRTLTVGEIMTLLGIMAMPVAAAVYVYIFGAGGVL